MANVTVLQNECSALSNAPHSSVLHRSGQIVGTNHLVGEQHAEYGIDRAKQAIAHIRLPARLDGINICGAKDVHVRKSSCGQCLLSLALVPSEGHAASLGWIGATPAQEGECRVGTAGAEYARELDRVVHSDPVKFLVGDRAGVRT